MGEQQPPSGAESESEQERQRRLNALRDLARTGRDESSAGVAAQSRAQAGGALVASATRSRSWWAVRAALAGVLVVALVAGFLVIHNRTGPANAGTPAITIALSSCPSQALWSPDGHTLAVLALPCTGSGDDSSPPTLADGVITLYDAATGHATKQLPLAPVLTDPATAGGGLDGIGWSPDGQEIALEVNASANLVTGPTTSYLLALIPVSGGQAQTITTTRPASAAQEETSQAPTWNIPMKQSTGMLPVPLPIALNYGWTADGRLEAGQSFPPSGVNTLTGRPVGPHLVSFWSDGTLRPVFPRTSPGGPPDQTQPPVAVEFTSEPMAVWSPDGSEVTFATFSGLLAGDQPLTQALCAQIYPPIGVACPDAVIPAPDAVIAQLAKQARAPLVEAASNGSRYTVYPDLLITWNPLGTAVATILPADQFNSGTGRTSAGSQKTQATLLGTDGTHLGTRTYACGGSTCTTDQLAWSPSGAQLALLDKGRHVITLWSAR